MEIGRVKISVKSSVKIV